MCRVLKIKGERQNTKGNRDNLDCPFTFTFFSIENVSLRRF